MCTNTYKHIQTHTQIKHIRKPLTFLSLGEEEKSSAGAALGQALLDRGGKVPVKVYIQSTQYVVYSGVKLYTIR